MNYLSPNQLEMLKTLARVPKIKTSNLSDQQLEVCKHLETLGYASIEKVSYGVNYSGIMRPEELASVSITEGGKAFLATLDIDRIRYQHPYRLSIISTVIAGLALLLSLLSLYLQVR